MTDREEEILEILKINPLISQSELADKLKITRSSVAVHISNLIKKGYIQGKGYVLSEELNEVVVIGGANIDITGISNNNLISEDSNPGQISLSTGGVARNIAENLARLNVKVKLISAIGDDIYGDRIFDEGKSVGLDMSLCTKYADQSTSVYLQVLNSNKHMDVAISDMDIINKIDIELLTKYHRHLESAKVIVADGNLSEDVIDYLANNFGSKMFFDTVSTSKTHKIKTCYNKFLSITPNIIEVETLLDEKIGDYRDALIKLNNKGLKMPIITLGEKGVVYLDKGELVSVEPPKNNLISVTGAGDSFLSGVVYGYINNAPVKEMIDIGQALSKLTLESTRSVSDKINVDAVKKIIEESKNV